MRPLTSYSKVQRLIGAAIRNRSVFAQNTTVSKKLLNVGCGSNIVPEFINLDYAWRPGIDICWDITHPLPFPGDCLTGIFSEHCLEHVSYWDGVGVVLEFFRVLAAGGTVRLIVPDGGRYLDLYHRATLGEVVAFPYIDTVGRADLEEDSRIRFTPMMAVNRIFRGYGHLFAYDFATLASLLEHAGFVDVQQAEYGRGRCPALLVDSTLRAPQSLYIEGTKPAPSGPIRAGH